MTPTDVTAYIDVPADLVKPLWTMYDEAFRPLATLAVQRHVMWWEEFGDLINDRNVTKLVAVDEHGPSGLALITNDLSAVPLVSPDYFAHRWPALYGQGRVWYVPFVCTRQSPAAARGVFSQLVTALIRPVRDSDGVAVMDYCDWNVDRRLPQVSGAILNRSYQGGQVTRVDSQSFWAYNLTGGDLP